jgi:hypothetical protein
MNEPAGIEIPAPTAWPMIAAFGVMLLAAGLVTIAVVSVVGAILATAGAFGWAREVFPRPLEVRVPLQAPALRARPVRRAAGGVDVLPAGMAGHRVRLPVEIQPYSSGVRGGLAGAVAMAAVAALYGMVTYGSPWYPINLLASTVSPPMIAASVETLSAFHSSSFLLAVIIHGLLSLLAGLVYAAVLPMLPGRSMLWGGVVAPVLWSGVAYLALGVVSPTMDQQVSWPWFLASQVAFGLVCGGVVARSKGVKTMQYLPLAVRAGVEAPGLLSEDEERPEDEEQP